MLAPTGLAAMNIGGQTVHSFFGFPPRPLIGYQEKPNWFFTQNARGLKRLIVDEVSMLRADVLDAMDAHLRAARKRSRLFGGVQMLLVGDFYQLPPVVRGEEGQLLEEAGYASPYAFSAQVLRDAPIAGGRADRSAPPDRSRISSTLLSGDPRARGVERSGGELNASCLGRELARRPVLLCATNAVADRYNCAASPRCSGEARALCRRLRGRGAEKRNAATAFPRRCNCR